MDLVYISNDSHIASAGIPIQRVIDNITDNMSEDEFHNSLEISRLQFITCQLQNSLASINRRRYIFFYAVFVPQNTSDFTCLL